jgi:uncharacterized membrane protein
MAEGPGADSKGLQLGKRIAPPRFLLFLFLSLAGSAALIPALGWGRGTMAAFDIAAAVFLVAIIPLFRQGEAAQMREASRANDANRPLLLITTSVVTLTVLAAVGSAVQDAHDPLAIGLVVATLILSWTFSNLIYALHYAHLYYSEEGGGDARGLCFQDCDEPDYWDFLYFSNTLGMAFATSDTFITARRIRRVALGQTYAAFIFNLGVIAFAVGALGG